jgi:uncharacterized protein YecE (DUF72 family)
MPAPKARPQVRVGTSGWSYGHWRGTFYPESLPQKEWLAHYAQHFDTVEVNSTFYHLPRESTCEGWRERAPDGFLYALKASRMITHLQRLLDAAEPLNEFLRRARLLEEHLGPVLFQLPPSLEVDLDRLGAFLELLPPEAVGVFEFRNDSWYREETYSLLEARAGCFCTHDMPGHPSPRRVTGPAAYVRFHGPARRYTGAYADEDLAEWAEWLAGWRRKGKNVFACFNNDIGGHAVNDAKKLRNALAELDR